MPRRNAWASASARCSSGSRASGTRADTRARPSRTSAALTNDPVFGEHVGEVTTVDVERRAFLFQAHPPMQHQLREPVASFASERRGGVVTAANLRRVDAQQPHTADRGDVDGVAVDDGANEHRIGPRGARGERGRLNGSNSGHQHSDQNLHSRLHLARVCADREGRGCKQRTREEARFVVDGSSWTLARRTACNARTANDSRKLTLKIRQPTNL